MTGLPHDRWCAHLTAPPAGIALFTYHKYRKSIDSPVPLDAHGNPISDDINGVEDAHHLHVIADEERQPLAASVEHEEQVSRTFFVLTSIVSGLAETAPRNGIRTATPSSSTSRMARRRKTTPPRRMAIYSAVRRRTGASTSNPGSWTDGCKTLWDRRDTRDGFTATFYATFFGDASTMDD